MLRFILRDIATNYRNNLNLRFEKFLEILTKEAELGHVEFECESIEEGIKNLLFNEGFVIEPPSRNRKNYIIKW